MEFRTILKPQKTTFCLGYDTPIVAIGSCFAENIGEKLNILRLPILVNPTGIVFNPVSLAESIEMLLGKYSFSENDIFQNDFLWHSFRLHGRFSSAEKEQLLRGGTNAILEGHEFLKTSKYLILTLGTAWVFEEKISKKIVANCHKVAAINFERRRLTVEECVKPLLEALKKAFIFNPDLKIILSVSPVRHLKDGFVENQRSKATLILAAETICQYFEEQIFYFPAYELLLDDLRDYRFFANDMTHPSEQAILYIFDFFKQTFFDEKTNNLVREVEKINQALSHRPLHPDSEAFKKFSIHLTQKITALQQKFEQSGLKIRL